MMNRWFVLVLLVLIPFTSAADLTTQPVNDLSTPASVALPVEIKPTDELLYYVGRFDRSNDRGPRAQWSHSSVTLRFTGTDLQVSLNDSGKNYFAVVIDGVATTTLHPPKGAVWLDVAKGLPEGEHIVSIVKRTEAIAGTTQFIGFRLNEGGKLLEPKRLPHRIEIIGDSITCGFGNESASKDDPFTFTTENAYMTYGSIAARNLNAEYVSICWSGRKMSPDNTIPSIYDRTLPMVETSKWNAPAEKPEVVVINLATNDFSAKVAPDKTEWVKQYRDFIKHLRETNAEADIYVAVSPMLFGEKRSAATDCLTTVVSEENAAGDKRVRLIEFPIQDIKNNGVGAKWHPNVKTHQQMGAQLSEQIHADLGWKLVQNAQN